MRSRDTANISNTQKPIIRDIDIRPLRTKRIEQIRHFDHRQPVTPRAERRIAVELAKPLSSFCMRPQVALDLAKGANFCTIGTIAVNLAHTRGMLCTKRRVASQLTVEGGNGRTVGRLAMKL